MVGKDLVPKEKIEKGIKYIAKILWYIYISIGLYGSFRSGIDYLKKDTDKYIMTPSDREELYKLDIGNLVYKRKQQDVAKPRPVPFNIFVRNDEEYEKESIKICDIED